MPPALPAPALASQTGTDRQEDRPWWVAAAGRHAVAPPPPTMPLPSPQVGVNEWTVGRMGRWAWCWQGLPLPTPLPPPCLPPSCTPAPALHMPFLPCLPTLPFAFITPLSPSLLSPVWPFILLLSLSSLLYRLVPDGQHFAFPIYFQMTFPSGTGGGNDWPSTCTQLPHYPRSTLKNIPSHIKRQKQDMPGTKQPV